MCENSDNKSTVYAGSWATGTPEHRSPWGVESFICEEAVSCRHPRSVKSHQTVELFQRHAHRPLEGGKKCREREQPSVLLKSVFLLNAHLQQTEQWGHTCRLTNSWKAWSIAERLWSKSDLNFIFSTSLNVSKTTARSWKGGEKMKWFGCSSCEFLCITHPL